MANENPNGREPQFTLTGTLKNSDKSDIITFKLQLLGVIELVFIVAVPEEDKKEAPVYVKVKRLERLPLLDTLVQRVLNQNLDD